MFHTFEDVSECAWHHEYVRGMLNFDITFFFDCQESRHTITSMNQALKPIKTCGRDLGARLRSDSRVGIALVDNTQDLNMYLILPSVPKT